VQLIETHLLIYNLHIKLQSAYRHFFDSANFFSDRYFNANQHRRKNIGTLVPLSKKIGTPVPWNLWKNQIHSEL
jgi:hypothetical protein